MKKLIGYIVLAGIALFVLIQLVPYGRQHANPPVVKEPDWGSPAARQVAQRACFDCHSNETVWPWYSHVAPVSWLLQNHVDEGRETLNFSDWTGQVSEGRKTEDALHAIQETVLEGEMPMSQYVLVHPAAKLSSADVNTLLQGLSATASR